MTKAEAAFWHYLGFNDLDFETAWRLHERALAVQVKYEAADYLRKQAFCEALDEIEEQMTEQDVRDNFALSVDTFINSKDGNGALLAKELGVSGVLVQRWANGTDRPVVEAERRSVIRKIDELDDLAQEELDSLGDDSLAEEPDMCYGVGRKAWQRDGMECGFCDRFLSGRDIVAGTGWVSPHTRVTKAKDP